MTPLQSILLGLIQGITEFLPISSSAHLVLLPYFMHWDIPPREAFAFNVLVQAATLLAVIVYFHRDLWSILLGFFYSLKTRQRGQDSSAYLGWLIILATLPAGMIGLLLKEEIEQAFSDPLAVGIFLWCTAIILFFSERVGRRTRFIRQLTWWEAMIIGGAQALAVFPGVSRSGATIAGGLSRDLQRPEAARFSFLMSIPIVFAAGLMSFIDLLELNHTKELLLQYLPGLIAAALLGYFSIHWLLKYLRQRSFYPFAIYCAILGTVTIILTQLL